MVIHGTFVLPKLVLQGMGILKEKKKRFSPERGPLQWTASCPVLLEQTPDLPGCWKWLKGEEEKEDEHM